MQKFTSGTYVGIALIIASLVFGSFFYASRASKDVISVIGYASVDGTANVVKWNFTLQKAVGLAGLKDGYKGINDDLLIVKSILLDKLGVDKKDILVNPINVENLYENNNVTGYNIVQNIQVIARGEALEKVSDYSLNPTDFLDKSIIFRSSYLEYTISDISKIKRQLLSKATDDAKQRALAIAKSSKNRIGKLESLRVGVFQITPPLSTEVSDAGIYNTSTKEKSISVTVNANFYLH
ncbi:MAG: SIMPL domain-containing protein [Candidatus Caenarcaniphilales bacterium]|nr:SIMPL domain-containing protein [Candidatus Caenarcaniphilales bacterium]